ncbi:Flavin-containing monooxygenase YUCCA3 [Termitomyces sp. T112]|nr:Flavin-containing monooxygenase YUCCA3 [Termitomyces sp. T112]
MTANDLSLPEPSLPTLQRLNATIPADLDAKAVAKAWFSVFARTAEAGNAQDVAKLFVNDGYWRDMLALTWDFRTFSGLSKITQFLADRLGSARPTAFALRDDAYLGLQRPYPDIAWINLFFDFETSAGIAFGIARLIPNANGEWKAHTVYTNLEDIKGFPEKIGPLRDANPNHGKWVDDRKREVEFVDRSPVVLIVGGGQSGLEVAARLKALDVPTLVVEKNQRIGDNWRNRYNALCLHDPVWYDHMPYLPFPPTWPVYAPAPKLANWLENYAETLELNVWTSSTVVKATQDGDSWNVRISRGDGSERAINANHIVFATGLGGNDGTFPKYPGMNSFKGQILHSTRHKSAADHLGKKVVVVGACTSAHDICADYYAHGIDVTMYQRSSTYIMSATSGWKVLMEGVYSEGGLPTDIADRVTASFPHHFNVGLSQRSTKAIAELDKDLLDALRARGFKVNSGIQGTGFGFLVWSRAGGYYLDTGASQLIADGKIKLKAGSSIESFTETGLKFEDGSELSADVVIFATGLSDSRAHIRKIVSEEVFKSLKPIWGLDPEGELNGIWRDLGVKGLWSMLGNLALCRFHSKHIALQIKAMEEGVFGERYSANF